MLNLNEAILREFNLYPLWQKRAMTGSDSPVALPAEQAPVRLAELSNTPLSSPLPATKKLAVLDWSGLKNEVGNCTLCALRAGCAQPIFASGHAPATWLFIGDTPSADDDATGEAFAGQAGKLLDNMLAAMQLKRGNQVCLTHLVKCRPAAGAPPQANEIGQCQPYLHRQIERLQPKIIVALGETVGNFLLGEQAELARLRGTLHHYQGVPLLVTYSPRELLLTPAHKAHAWQDLCLARVNVERD
jgi:uracil-DNA glycosylase